MVEILDKKLFRIAQRFMPGGVNSPVRAFGMVGGYPVFIRRAKGAKIYSESGKEFIDYCLGWGAMIIGHADPEVVKTLREAINNGFSFGAATKLEIDLARLINEAVPSMEKIRLTNSGTEAVMTAIRLARAFSRKNKIIKFSGSYHGSIDYMLDCAGIGQGVKKDTLVAPYNEISKVQKLVERYKDDIAAIIVEPVSANMGVVLPKEDFLFGLRKITEQHNIVLIFDEVVTGFRFNFGGAQELFGIKPDLTCLGKIIGGGLPVGAVGGRSKIMQMLAPLGDVYQAGTFCGNPLTVKAGLATLRLLKKYMPYHHLQRLSDKLCFGIRKIAQAHKLKVRVNSLGGMFSIFFSGSDVVDYRTACRQDKYLFRKFYHGLLNKGIYLSPSCFEANFLSFAHSDGDIDKTLEVTEEVFTQIGK